MSAETTIQELLERGLYHYGLGEIGKAIEFWREVLRREPGNETAREYIEIETGRTVETTAPAPSITEALDLEEAEIIEEPHAPGLPAEFSEGQNFLHRGELQKAMGSFEAAHRLDPSNPFYWAHVELSRAKIIKEVLDQMGGWQAEPALKVPLDKLIGQKNFTQEEGFVLSLISGETSLRDVVALSPLPRFHTYRILYNLLQEGLVTVKRGPR